MPRPMSYDRWLFLTTAALSLGGVLMVGSASNYAALGSGQDPTAFFVQHLAHLLLGMGVLVVALTVRYEQLNRRALVMSALGVFALLLIAVLFTPAVNGARRWIPVGPVRLQPSELCKVLVVVFMAYMLSRKEDHVNDLRRVVAPCAAVVGGLAYLIAVEPDLGSAVMLGATAAVMLFVAGLSVRNVAIGGAAGAAAFVIGIFAEPYRMMRIRGFLESLLDPTLASRSNFQLQQSFIAIGSGGLTGVGLGNGSQKAYYIPATHTDFIYATIGEELGLLGTGAVLLAFLVIFWRGMRAALRAPDRFGFYLALGLTFLLVTQGLVNMAVCLGLLPTKGLALPFVSYGGSSLLATMAAMGLLLNVSQHSN